MEHFFTCPYCWERISMVIDSYEEESDYIEDCEVCCRPIEIKFRFSDERLISFESKVMEGIQLLIHLIFDLLAYAVGTFLAVKVFKSKTQLIESESLRYAYYTIVILGAFFGAFIESSFYKSISPP